VRFLRVAATRLRPGPDEKQRAWKAALRPIPDWPTASSMTISARRSASVVEENGFTSTKSMVPAICVFSPMGGEAPNGAYSRLSGGNFRQFSVLPSPSDVITPMPVTTTIGRLWASPHCHLRVTQLCGCQAVSSSIVIRRPRRAPFLRRANDRRPRPLSGPASGRFPLSRPDVSFGGTNAPRDKLNEAKGQC